MRPTDVGPPAHEVTSFLRAAHVRGWPAGVSKVSIAGLGGFEQTRYSDGPFEFIDLYRGATTDVGLELIFCEGRQVWGAVYRGGHRRNRVRCR